MGLKTLIELACFDKEVSPSNSKWLSAFNLNGIHVYTSVNEYFRVLANFDNSAPSIVTMDASGIALGAAFSQIHKGLERPVAVASLTLQPAESLFRW